MKDVTTNQHYVWRHYLEAWGTPKTIWCKRSDKADPFAVIPKKVAAKNFFYEIHELKEADLYFLNWLISQATDKRLQEINRKWLEGFQTTFEMRRQLSGSAPTPQHLERLENKLRRIERTLIEDWHGGIERRAVPILEALRRGDAGFYKEKTAGDHFIDFLSHQFFRTARIRNAMLAIQHRMPHDIRRTWPIEAFIYATNLGSSFARQRSQYRIVFLRNRSEVSFITTDQPVINLIGIESGTDEVDLYYPLKPDLAMIYTADPTRYGDKEVELNALEVDSYNRRLVAMSDSQIYGTDPEHLKDLSAA